MSEMTNWFPRTRREIVKWTRFLYGILWRQWTQYSWDLNNFLSNFYLTSFKYNNSWYLIIFSICILVVKKFSNTAGFQAYNERATGVYNYWFSFSSLPGIQWINGVTVKVLCIFFEWPYLKVFSMALLKDQWLGDMICVMLMARSWSHPAQE